jgi:hypothetical protein
VHADYSKSEFPGTMSGTRQAFDSGTKHGSNAGDVIGWRMGQAQAEPYELQAFAKVLYLARQCGKARQQRRYVNLVHRYDKE